MGSGSASAPQARGRIFPVLALAFVLLVPVVIAACGKKGPPLPPLRLIPAPVSEVSARRSGDRVELRFMLPTTNQNGPGRVELGRVEIYAVTLAPGAPTPANPDLLTKARLVGTVPVRPAPREGEEPAAADPADTRPGPGERATFIEELTPDKLEPVVLATPSAPGAQGPAPTTPAEPRPGAPDAATAPTAPATAPAAPATQEASATAPGAAAALHPTRIYVIRGATAGGRPGAPGPRLAVSLAPLPAPPTSVAGRFTERAIILDWVPPVAEPGGAVPSFNVYGADAVDAPLNPAPITTSEFEQPGLAAGQEQCFVVRTVIAAGNVALESANSDTRCVTPRDVFPPAAPAGLQAVAAPDAVELSWDANKEADLAGYVVLRGEPAGDTLQPLMTAPTRETTWRDTTAQSGVRYVYAVIAVDNATPPNASPQSARQEITAR